MSGKGIIPCSHQKMNSACWQVGFSRVRRLLDFCPTDCKIISLCCFEPLNLEPQVWQGRRDSEDQLFRCFFPTHHSRIIPPRSPALSMRESHQGPLHCWWQLFPLRRLSLSNLKARTSSTAVSSIVATPAPTHSLARSRDSVNERETEQIFQASPCHPESSPLLLLSESLLRNAHFSGMWLCNYCKSLWFESPQRSYLSSPDAGLCQQSQLLCFPLWSLQTALMRAGLFGRHHGVL